MGQGGARCDGCPEPGRGALERLNAARQPGNQGEEAAGARAHTGVNEDPPMTELIVKLPDDLAQRAREAGLLTDEAIEKLLRAAIAREQGIDELFAAMDRMAAVPDEPMSEDEIQAEIDAARADRRARGR
jgi:hypothetical protein